jgi:hypothetical protein
MAPNLNTQGVSPPENELPRSSRHGPSAGDVSVIGITIADARADRQGLIDKA